MYGKIRVLLADDHNSIRAQVRLALSEEFYVVGAVDNGRDTVDEVRRLDPDVLLIDISLPLLDGLQAVPQLRSIHPRTKVVLLTVHEDQEFIDAAFSAGGSGYVAKADVTTDLVPAIHEALAGRTFVSRSVSRCSASRNR